MAFDAFISYASQDKLVADAVCARLEAAGIRCWIAPRDITPGMSYGEAIINAIHQARVMILVFSSHANTSPQVPKEIERAVSNNVPIIPYRIENVTPGASLDYFIGSVHWLDALTPPMEQHLDSLVTTVRKLVPPRDGEVRDDVPPRPGPTFAAPSAPAAAAPRVTPPQSAAPLPTPRSNTALIIGGIVLAAIVLFALYKFTTRPSDNGGTQDNTNNTQPAPDPSPAPGPKQGDSKNASPAPTRAPSDPVVGCYAWGNGQTVVIRSNGTLTAGPFTGRWVRTSNATLQFTWPPMIVTVTAIGQGAQTFTAANNYGFTFSGQRTGVGIGLTGKWRWNNGWNVDVRDDGSFTTGQYSGTWRSTDSNWDHYEMTWPAPVDSIGILDNGARLGGVNNYGIAGGGLRVSCPR